MVSIVVCRCNKQGYLFILRCTATEKVHAILNLWPSADLLLLCISVLKSENTILTIPTHLSFSGAVSLHNLHLLSLAD